MTEIRQAPDVPPAVEDEYGFVYRSAVEPRRYRPSWRVLVLAWLCDLMRRWRL